MDKNKIVSWCVVVLTAALISVFFLSAPANAGVSPDVGRYIDDNGKALIGETNLSFGNETTPISEGIIKSNWADSHIIIPFDGPFDSSRYEDELVPGDYKVIGDEREIIIYFLSPKLDVKTKVREEDFEWVTRGGDILFEADTNLWVIKGEKPNNITYKLLDPDGLRVPEHKVGVSLSDINVSENGENITPPINTANLELGVYTLSIETDPATNNGLDVEGPAVTFEVKNIGVEIEAKPEEQVVTEEIVFTVSTTPHTDITLNVTRGIASNVWFGKGVGSGEVSDVKDGHSASGISDKNGNLKAVASFTETGGYDITATEHIVYTERRTTVKIMVYEIKLTAPTEGVYHIGEVLTIKGSANVGTNMIIKLDGSKFKEDALEFDIDYYWLTEESTPGTHKIEMWVLPLSDPERDPPDASVSIVLIRGGLFAETSADFVALGDEFKIEGTVPGRDRVDIFTIAPDGGGGRGLDSDDIFNETDGDLNAPGLTHHICGITDEKFKKDKIKVSVDADTGIYLIPVLNYGRDRTWGKSGSDNLLGVISNNYAMDLGVKTTDQILAILKDRTINAAGTDDLLGIATISVEKGFVTLDDIDAVALNEEIKVTGTTNRQVDTSIIITVEGLDEKTPKLKPKITKVKEDPDNFYNKFEISFATASANIGRYEVTADDGDGHVATTTMNLLLAVEPSVNVSATSTPIVEPEGKGESEGAAAATPLQTPTPTAIEDTETEKEPGFEAVFSIAILLVVTWLMLRTRQQQRKDKKR